MKRNAVLPRLSALTAVIRGSCMAVAVLVPGLAAAAPAGGQVVAGQIAIAQPDGRTTRITQTSASGIIDWQAFSIASDERVVFNQPSASATVLNRVTGGAPSEIFGRLQANGRVFLINPQGLLFGAGSKVDVGGLVATTMNIADEDFLAGRYVFGGGGHGSVSAAGSITAADGGFVVLGADRVGNSGLISARLGDVLLASGSQMTLSLDAAGLVGYAVDGVALAGGAGVENLGRIAADGGRVVLTARTAREIAGAAVNNSGRISARSIAEHEGEIVLSADADLRSGGALDVSGMHGADGGRISAVAGGDIVLAAGSEVLANGRQGGEARFVAEGALELERGAGADVSGKASGGTLELSGHEHARIRGDVEVGRGGRFVLDPAGGMVIGNGSSAADTCNADWCEAELEDMLKAGGDVEIVDGSSISFEDFTDGALDGRNGGHGGSLFLGIGSGDSGNFSPDFSAGSGVQFADAGDSLLLDGEFSLSGGTVVSLGKLSVRSISVFSGGTVSTGDLSAVNADGAAAIVLDTSGKVTVNGGIVVNGHVDAFDVADDLEFEFPAARLSLASIAEGGIEVTGAITVNGSVGSASLNTQSVYGSWVDLYAANDDIVLHGPLNLSGSVGSVSAPVNIFDVHGVKATILSEFGGVTLLGDVTVNGTVGSVTGPELTAVNGVDFSVSSYNLAKIQGLNVTGSVTTITGGGGYEARGAQVKLFSDIGDFRLLGPALLNGSVGTATGADGQEVDGLDFSLLSSFGGVSLAQGLVADGAVGAVSGGRRISASGVDLSLISEQDLKVTGGISAHGTVGSFSSTDEFNEGGDSGAVGAYLSLLNFSGATDLRGAVSVTGSVGQFSADEGAFAIGAFVNASSFAEYGTGKNLVFRDALGIHGSLGALAGGEFSQMTGAGLYVDSIGANIAFGGKLSMDGLIDNATLGFGSDASAAYATVSASSAAVRVNQAANVTGRINRVHGASSLSASGATISMQAAIAPAAGNPSLNVDDIRQSGSIGVFEAGDEESSSRYDGGVRLDAGMGSIAFGDVNADNLFIYFDSDSAVAGSALRVRDYLEIYTDSFGPKLSGTTLRIDAGNAFLSAYLSYEQLTVNASDAITLYLGQLEANDLVLRTGGALTMIGGSDAGTSNPTFLSALSLDVQADSVYGDAGSQIYADALAMRARDTILLEGAVYAGGQLAAAGGDAGMIERLHGLAPDLVPASAGPNAFFSADTVALSSFNLTGDYVQVQSNYFFLGSAQLEQAGTLVHLSPLSGLPFFAESVDVNAVGLADVANRARTDNGRITPNIGRFDDARGSNGPLGERVALSGAAARGPGELEFSVDQQQPLGLGQLIFDAGLADSTLVIGGSDFAGAIQISDQLAVDVRPSQTNFVFLTRSAILGFDRVLTDGQVVLLDGELLTSPEEFYKLVAKQFADYYAAQEGPAGDMIATTEGDDEDGDELVCE